MDITVTYNADDMIIRSEHEGRVEEVIFQQGTPEAQEALKDAKNVANQANIGIEFVESNNDKYMSGDSISAGEAEDHKQLSAAINQALIYGMDRAEKKWEELYSSAFGDVENVDLKGILNSEVKTWLPKDAWDGIRIVTNERVEPGRFYAVVDPAWPKTIHFDSNSTQTDEADRAEDEYWKSVLGYWSDTDVDVEELETKWEEFHSSSDVYASDNQADSWPNTIEIDVPIQQTKEKTMTLKAQLQDQIDRASDRLRKIERFPDDDFETGTVIAFARSWDGDKVYEYAGVKLDNGGWVITGPKHPYSLGWDALVEELATDGECLAFCVVTEMEDLLQ